MRAEFTSIEPEDVPPSNLGPQICVHITFLLCLIKQKLSLSASVPCHPQLPNPCPCVYFFLGVWNLHHLTSYTGFSQRRSYPSNLLPIKQPVAVGTKLDGPEALQMSPSVH